MGYQQDYYQSRREEILRDRALRYASDPAYREAVKERARISNMNRRAVPREVASTIKFAGKQEKFHRIMELPPLLKRNYSVIREWLLSGVMPKPCCRDSAGKAVFSRSQTILMQFVVQQVDSDILRITYPEMKAILHKFWRVTFNKLAVLRELKRLRDDNRMGEQLGSANARVSELYAPKEKRRGATTKSRRVSKAGSIGSRTGTLSKRHGRKVRREDKGDQA